MRANATPVEWCAGIVLFLAVVSGVAGCAIDAFSIVAGGTRSVQLVGLVVTIAGVIATFLAQLAMGDSWRIGVSREEYTTLVTGGPYGYVRNPIYTAMLVTTLGFALMVPNVLSWLALVLMLAGLELQVRFVEEPYLTHRHGETFRAYSRAVGRFLPGLGRAS